MASGDKEHRMLFDLRGRRRNAIKVVYAVLAILMGASLFLTVGPFSIAEIFSDGGTVSVDAAEQYEEQAERIEAKLKKDPEDPDLLASLTRAQLNAGIASAEIEDNRTRVQTAESIQHYQQASDTWAKYLKTTDDPSANVAQLMATTLVTLAEFSRAYPQTLANLDAGVAAQRIVAEKRPSVNSLTTLALYTYFTGDYAAAEEARAKAKKLARNASERQAIDTPLDEAKKRAEAFQEEVARVKRQQRAAGGGGQGSLEGGNALSEALSGSSLSE